MNECYVPDDALDDQLRRFYQDVYEPIEPASQMWKKVASQLDVASPPRKGILATRQPSARGSTLLETTPHSGGMRRRLRSAVAVLVTGIIIVASLALFHMSHVQSVTSPSVTHGVPTQAYSTANVPVTPVATPGPQEKYVYDIVTSNGVDPTGFGGFLPTSHFPAGTVVDVICNVRGITRGQKHTVSIHWYYDGQYLTNAQFSRTVDSNQVMYFALTYPAPGLGMAKIFFDLPSNDSGDQANDPYLAGQIYFAIDPATP